MSPAGAAPRGAKSRRPRVAVTPKRSNSSGPPDRSGPTPSGRPEGHPAASPPPSRAAALSPFLFLPGLPVIGDPGGRTSGVAGRSDRPDWLERTFAPTPDRGQAFSRDPQPATTNPPVVPRPVPRTGSIWLTDTDTEGNHGRRVGRGPGCRRPAGARRRGERSAAQLRRLPDRSGRQVRSRRGSNRTAPGPRRRPGRGPPGDGLTRPAEALIPTWCTRDRWRGLLCPPSHARDPVTGDTAPID